MGPCNPHLTQNTRFPPAAWGAASRLCPMSGWIPSLEAEGHPRGNQLLLWIFLRLILALWARPGGRDADAGPILKKPASALVRAALAVAQEHACRACRAAFPGRAGSSPGGLRSFCVSAALWPVPAHACFSQSVEYPPRSPRRPGLLVGIRFSSAGSDREVCGHCGQSWCWAAARCPPGPGGEGQGRWPGPCLHAG